MVWWIRPLEIANDDGSPSGKWRLTAKSDEDGGGPFGLCQHCHGTPDDACECPDANAASAKY